MFTKHATLETSQILGIKGSSERIRTATLDKFADFADYRTEDGYLYARLRAISSRVNKNHDAWPSVELAGGPESWQRYTSNGRTAGFTVQAESGAKYGYATFLHKPCFIDHNNSDPSRARGVVVDSKLHVEDGKTSSLDPYYASAPDNHKPPTWVELLVEVDAKSFPKMAKDLIEGGKNPKRGLDGWSMGANVLKTVCSICKNAATTPEEYCKHVKLKGAHFDSYDHLGHRTSKKAYEDCYGIQFFEISAVFDPADETALSREVRSSRKTAENPAPQKDMTKAPEQLDTLREDDVCEVCGSTMDGPTCKVCDWKKPPDGFDNPDLQKLHPEIEAEREGTEDPNADPVAQAGGPDIGEAQDNATKVMGSSAVKDEMSGWQLSLHPRVAGRINVTEQPIKPQGPVSNEPKETILSDQQKPVLKRTAADLIAATKETTMDRVADAASGAPAVASPDQRVETVGVGGVMTPSNEEASKADGQIDVEGIGGTGVEGVEADSHDHVDHGDEHSKTTDDSGPTKTFGQGSGVEHQEDPVSRDPFPPSDEGVKQGAKVAYDDEAYPKNDGGLAGGSASPGNKPVAESFGERVDVLDHVTSPENNSGPTKTWSGTDGNSVNRQQEPVTNEPQIQDGDKVNLFSSKHLFAAFKLADAEVDLGLIEKDQKYNRVAELQELSSEALAAEARVISRVRTAGVRRQATTKPGGVGRMPSMRQASAQPSVQPREDDASLFL